MFTSRLPTTPGTIIDGILKIQELVQNEGFRRRYSKEYEHLLKTHKDRLMKDSPGTEPQRARTGM